MQCMKVLKLGNDVKYRSLVSEQCSALECTKVPMRKCIHRVLLRFFDWTVAIAKATQTYRTCNFSFLNEGIYD